MGLRDTINEKPWVGWAVAGVLLLVSLYFVFMRGGGGDTFSSDNMMRMVTIKFTDTGKTEQMPYGRLVKQLSDQARNAGGKVDPSKGLINPETNQPTGILIDDGLWKATLERIQLDMAESKRLGTTAPPPPPPSR